MLCSISGQVPVEPVVSIKSGHVFEKRLILQYLTQNQSRCPVTNDELDAEKDLLAINVASSSTSTAKNLTSFSPEAASIPQILALFQNEWDAVMLETFTLKKHLEKTRQELSHALYQHDAACRVIARLNHENEALRVKLTTRSSSTPQGDDVDMDASTATGLSVEAIATIEAKQKALAKQRKDFKKKEGPLRAERLQGVLTSWTATSSHTIHDSDKPGILSVAVDPKNPQLLATGGVDKNVKLFNTASQQIVATLRGHTKKISQVAFHPSAQVVVSASYDQTVKVWSASASASASDASAYTAVHTLTGHDAAVTGASIHATGDYIVSASLDASWGFFDLRSGKLLSRSFLNGESKTSGNDEALCVSFHPDGGLFATGSKQKMVQMWDPKSMANVATFEGHANAVESLDFSENGYHLATGSSDGMVKIWDLRKLASIFEHNFNNQTVGKAAGGPVHSVSFDASGAFLAVASGSRVHVLNESGGKNNWQVVKSFDDHKAAVTSLAFASDSSFLATTSMDRSLKLYR